MESNQLNSPEVFLHKGQFKDNEFQPKKLNPVFDDLNNPATILNHVEELKGNGNYTTAKVKKTPYKKSLAVKKLEQMATDEAQQKYPTIPSQWLAPRRYRDDTANGLTKCIIDFLKLSGWQAERISNTGRPIDERKTFIDVTGCQRTIGRIKWIPGSGQRGTADISATIAGRAVKIEVKIGSDRQSPAQRDYQKAIEQAGGIYIIARSFEQFLDWYNVKFEGDE